MTPFIDFAWPIANRLADHIFSYTRDSYKLDSTLVYYIPLLNDVTEYFSPSNWTLILDVNGRV